MGYIMYKSIVEKSKFWTGYLGWQTGGRPKNLEVNCNKNWLSLSASLAQVQYFNNWLLHDSALTHWFRKFKKVQAKKTREIK